MRELILPCHPKIWQAKFCPKNNFLSKIFFMLFGITELTFQTAAVSKTIFWKIFATK
jgi:hypothetical protein